MQLLINFDQIFKIELNTAVQLWAIIRVVTCLSLISFMASVRQLNAGISRHRWHTLHLLWRLVVILVHLVISLLVKNLLLLIHQVDLVMHVLDHALVLTHMILMKAELVEAELCTSLILLLVEVELMD